ncbi:hypothetical protein RRG08_001894 [Elysia crispata]|uniref:Uncharacterized protein n=1 Tax=Elysia crispata TaxID=231223 RepID=A0AAE1DU39_9GAST|nr:hypothetical protein RRG08_001894 [Elysia crispata]
MGPQPANLQVLVRRLPPGAILVTIKLEQVSIVCWRARLQPQVSRLRPFDPSEQVAQSVIDRAQFKNQVPRLLGKLGGS